MADFSPREQLMLELVNRARLDPAGEARRLGIALNEGSPNPPISSAPKQVLAGNDQLGLAADKHSNWMVINDQPDHFETEGTPGFYGEDPWARMALAGYAAGRGENIAFWNRASGLTGSVVEMYEAFFVDAGTLGRGHRANILHEDYNEIGIGHRYDSDSSVITQDFGSSGGTFITGVVYDDTTTSDNFFTVGEQVAGRTVSGSGESDRTGAGGGYELGYATSGNKTITFDLADADLKVKVKLGDTNVKVDAVNGDEIWTNASSLVSQSAAIKELHALGIARVNLTGTKANEKITGNDAANSLNGRSGSDVISGDRGGDTIIGAYGRDTLTGGRGDDKFVFKAAKDSKASNPDVITDFDKHGNDKIKLSALGDLDYRDEAAIDGAGQVSVSQSGSDVIVHINLDADLADEMRIRLDHTSLGSMSASDFIL